MNFNVYDKISLFSHLAIDVNYNCYRTNFKLNEACGLIPDSHVYGNMFDEWLEKEILPNLNPEEVGFQFFNKRFELQGLIKDERITTPFVEYIGVQVKTKQVNDVSNVRFTCCFDIDNSHFNCTELDNDSVDPLVFAMYRLSRRDTTRPCVCIGMEILYNNPAFVKYHASYNFLHEMTHAYDAYCRYKNGAKPFVDTYFYDYYEKLPGIMAPKKDQPLSDEQAIGAFIYYTCNVERNALNGQFEKEIDGAKEYFNMSDDVWNAMTQTSVWRRSKFCEGMANKIASETDPKKSKSYLEIFNRLSGKHFTDYKKLVSYANKLSKHFTEKVIRHAAAFSSKKIGENGMKGVDNFVGIENKLDEWLKYQGY